MGEKAKACRSMMSGQTAEQLRALMQALKISDYEILRPRSDQTLINYGVRVHFSKTER